VKIEIIATMLLLAISAYAGAEKPEVKDSISVTFAVDGKPVACGDSKIELRLDGRTVVPKRTDHGFAVPVVFNKKPSEWSPDKKVYVTVSCGEYTLNFPKVEPGWVRSGQWEFGIAYPPYWIERFGYLSAIEQGTWLSYLEFNCDECDPGVFTTISHPTPPALLLSSLRREQPNSSGGRARDIAYALAVFGNDYQRNRDYLLELLNACLSRPKESSENDVCDRTLLGYVTNLYWRGDSALLRPLLQLAESRKDVILEIGTFYANLLDRRTTTTVDGIRKLPPEKQRMICKLAGEDEYSSNKPKLERVSGRLQAIGDETANRCRQEAERAAQ
jgi:hypothetical protein